MTEKIVGEMKERMRTLNEEWGKDRKSCSLILSLSHFLILFSSLFLNLLQIIFSPFSNHSFSLHSIDISLQIWISVYTTWHGMYNKYVLVKNSAYQPKWEMQQQGEWTERVQENKNSLFLEGNNLLPWLLLCDMIW